uniref:Uncharacterized protein n=1 Tax=Setaria italica TaxID=4555 RepID=K3ZBG8_SETIT
MIQITISIYFRLDVCICMHILGLVRRARNFTSCSNKTLLITMLLVAKQPPGSHMDEACTHGRKSRSGRVAPS